MADKKINQVPIVKPSPETVIPVSNGTGKAVAVTVADILALYNCECAEYIEAMSNEIARLRGEITLLRAQIAQLIKLIEQGGGVIPSTGIFTLGKSILGGTDVLGNV